VSGASGSGPARRAAAAVLGAALLAGCEAEVPPMRESPPAAGQRAAPQTGDLQAGPERPIAFLDAGYESNPRAVQQGERLYMWMNCVGCHGALGGGGIGPPFADGDFIYGSAPANIFQSIVQGRPNGMPAYGGRLANQEIWKIVAYVRSIAGEPDHHAAPAGVSTEPGEGPAGAGAEGGGGQAGARETDVPGDAP
jgi:cytochrome c oxidase cbb3-type subunit III